MIGLIQNGTFTRLINVDITGCTFGGTRSLLFFPNGLATTKKWSIRKMHRNSSVQSGELSQNRQEEKGSPTLVLPLPATDKPTAASVFILSESAERASSYSVPVLSEETQTRVV